MWGISDTFEQALLTEQQLDLELEELGLLTSAKSGPPAQQGTFQGLGFDTVQDTFVLTADWGTLGHDSDAPQ